jgi:hypothetical protein
MEMNIVDIIDDRKGGKEAPSVIEKRQKMLEARKSGKSGKNGKSQKSETINPITESIKMSSH